jgi:hypothetical protein
MAQQKILTELAQQKELLMAEAELRRCLLAADCHRVTEPVRWVQQLPGRLGPWRHLLPIAAPVAGLMLTRAGASMGRWASRAFNGFRIAQQVMKAFSSKSEKP